jgi:hypothetical protein
MVLQSNYTPLTISHRQEQVESVASILAPALRGERVSNLFLFGKTGTGKTLTVKHVGNKILEKLKAENLSEEELQKEIQDLQKYIKYDYQDLAEITANKILKKEFKENNYNFTFMRTFEDLLTVGEQVMYVGVLGGKPVMRRVDPRNIFTLGGNSMHLEDSDIICEFDYQSVSQVIDDYWDVLTEKDIKTLENITDEISRIRDKHAYIGFDYSNYTNQDFCDNKIELLTPDQVNKQKYSKYYDVDGNIRVLRTCWRSRRKIGKLKYYDEDGDVQYTWVSENYKIDEFKGEEVEWKWVNEWRQGVKLGDDIYVEMGPIPYSAKSLVNKSTGTPPYIGIYNSDKLLDSINFLKNNKPRHFFSV